MTRSIDLFIPLGPYKAGEIPEDVIHTFLDDNDDPVWLGDETSSIAIHQFRRLGDDTAIERDCTILAQGLESEVALATRGQVRITWEEDDLETAGLYIGLVWVKRDDQIIASDELRWPVNTGPAVVPDFA